MILFSQVVTATDEDELAARIKKAEEENLEVDGDDDDDEQVRPCCCLVVIGVELRPCYYRY